jgi:hypothetical protein
MGFFNRLKAILIPISDEQLRQVFNHENIEIAAIYEVIVFNHLAPGYLILLTNGEGGFFRMWGEKLSVFANSGLHYRWRNGWGLIENPTKLDTNDRALSFALKRDPKTKRVFFNGHDDLKIEIDDAWTFWGFRFWKNTNSPNGATEHRIEVAIKGKGINLETLLKRIPI